MDKNIQRTESVHKSDAEIQFDWLRQVAADVDLPSTASRVAITLTSYFSRKEDGWAWMSQSRLASDLGVTERTVRDAMSALVARGHLILNRRGKMETNRYRVALKCESDRQKPSDHDRKKSSGQEGVTGKFTSSDRKKSSKVTGRNLPPNPLIEPLDEPNEERVSPRPDLGDEDFGRREVQPPDTVDTDFEIWFRQYPKRVARSAALRAYRTARKQVPAEILLSGAMRYAAERSGQDPRYTKHPATWLNGGCWADEQVTSIGSPAHSTPSGGNDHIARAAAMARQAQARRQAHG